MEHTREVIAESEKILSLILNGETAQRGYVITGNPKYLRPFQLAQAQLPQTQVKLRNLVNDNSAQVKRVDSLDRLIEEKQALIAEIIETRKTQGYESARLLIISDNKGENLGSRIRNLIDDIQSEEEQLLVNRKLDLSSSSKKSSQVFMLATVLVLTIVLLLFLYVFFTFRKRLNAEQDLAKSVEQLTIISNDNQEKNWVLSGLAALNESLNGDIDPDELCKNALNVLNQYTEASSSAFYVSGETTEALYLKAYNAIDNERVPTEILFGESYTGEAAIKGMPIYLNHPEGMVVKSALVSFQAHAAAFIPLELNGKTTGVIELIFSREIPNRVKDLLESASRNIAVALNAAQAKKHLEALFVKLQVQSEELESQQEELRITNEELNEQTKMLQTSEEELRAQQEELMQTNAELEEKAFLLEENNRTIEQARNILTEKTKQLEESNRFKSEFLANMSHELRTPLNSILILARILADNKDSRLSDDEAKYARVIFNSGNDLLSLINDILDLAKIESGKVELLPEDISLSEIKEDLDMLFKHVADEKKISFETFISKNAVARIFADKLKIEQIVRNLLSNAFKFTPEGGKVILEISQNHQELLFSVTDTGIGISPDKQKLIFEAFQQADGSTSRKYGGTGLGLSISRELAALMKGKIEVKSEEGQGSTFTLTIPIAPSADVEKQQANEVELKEEIKPVPVYDSNNTNILIIEDDPAFGLILQDFSKARGLVPHLAISGEQGIEKAEAIKPVAIILDISLPGMDGWEVLKNLKSRSETSKIPVHIISAGEVDKERMKKFGAIDFLRKPVKAEELDQLFNPLTSAIPKKFNKILVVEDAPEQNEHLNYLFTKQGYTVSQAYTGKEAVEKLKAEFFDCMVLDMRLPDTTGMDLLDELKKENILNDMPVVIHTASELTQQEQHRIMQHTSAMVLKTANSDSRILDEVKLFIHSVKEEQIKPSRSGNNLLNKTITGRKVLLVDDDMRNIFAMSSALQQYGMEIEIATNGLEALEKIGPETDIILMDIMMPEMDGYQAMKEIRSIPEYRDVPIIALTAKAMKEDRQKAMDAGANDYISKPVDIQNLISVISVWLSK